ncbi:hypothetical protein MNBD_DELTA03-1250, partial [hydrothermal vent metagenome]
MNHSMRAMVLKERGGGLELLNLPWPEAGEGQLLIQV